MDTPIVLLLLVALCVLGVVAAQRLVRRAQDAAERVRVRAQVAQARLAPPGPRRDTAVLRQQLAAQVRAARVVLGAPDGRVFRADAHIVLSEITAAAGELDATLAALARLTDVQRREALTMITPQVAQLITTTDTACRTLLRTRATARAGRLDALSSGIDFEAASLATYERDRNDLRL